MTIPYIKKSSPKAFWKIFSENLTLPCIILKNGEIYFKNLAVFTPQIFKVSLVIFQHHIWKGLRLLGKTFINECTLTNMRTIHPVTSLKENSSWAIFTAQKKKFSIKYFFSQWDQIHNFLRIWSHLLKKSFMKNFTFCADFLASNNLSRKLKIAGV